MPQGGELRDVRAAGAVVTRKGGDVLLVHRPKYDDWSFPKGKLDPGEHVVTAAVREVAEETGLDVRLGPALGRQRYRMSNGRWKTVDYWTARVVGSDDVGHYRPNDEIDAVEWVPWKEAERRHGGQVAVEGLGQELVDLHGRGVGVDVGAQLAAYALPVGPRGAAGLRRRHPQRPGERVVRGEEPPSEPGDERQHDHGHQAHGGAT